MKELIDKLFKWLGYVPKWYHTHLTRMLAIEQEIREHGAGYRIEHVCFSECGYYRYEIYAITPKGRALVKSIPYNMLDADSQAYARICAEELCEKLNEKY